MTKHATSHDTPTHADFMESVTRTGENCTKACLAWQEEWLRFVAARVQWDAKVGQALAACTSLTEVAEVQRDWLQATAADYFEEAGKLMRLALNFSSPSTAPATTAKATKPEFRAAAE